MPKPPKSTPPLTGAKFSEKGATVPIKEKYLDEETISSGHYRYLKELRDTAAYLREVGLSDEEIAKEWSGEEYEEKRFAPATGLQNIFREMEKQLSESAEKLGKSLKDLEREFVRSGKSLKDFIKDIENSSKQVRQFGGQFGRQFRYVTDILATAAIRSFAQGIVGPGGGIWGGGTGAQQIGALTNALTMIAPIMAQATGALVGGIIKFAGAAAAYPTGGTSLAVAGLLSGLVEGIINTYTKEKVAEMQVTSSAVGNLIQFQRMIYPMIGAGGLGRRFGGMALSMPEVVGALSSVSREFGYTPEDIGRFLAATTPGAGPLGESFKKIKENVGQLTALSAIGLRPEEIAQMTVQMRTITGRRGTELTGEVRGMVADLLGFQGVLGEKGLRPELAQVYLQQFMAIGKNVENIAMHGIDMKNVTSFTLGVEKAFKEVGGGALFQPEHIARIVNQLYMGMARPATPQMEAFMLQTLGFRGGLEEYVQLRAKLETFDPKAMMQVLFGIRDFFGGNKGLMALTFVKQFGLSFESSLKLAEAVTKGGDALKEEVNKIAAARKGEEQRQKKLDEVLRGFAEKDIPTILSTTLPEISKNLLELGIALSGQHEKYVGWFKEIQDWLIGRAGRETEGKLKVIKKASEIGELGGEVKVGEIIQITRHDYTPTQEHDVRKIHFKETEFGGAYNRYIKLKSGEYRRLTQKEAQAMKWEEAMNPRILEQLKELQQQKKKQAEGGNPSLQSQFKEQLQQQGLPQQAHKLQGASHIKESLVEHEEKIQQTYERHEKQLKQQSRKSNKKAPKEKQFSAEEFSSEKTIEKQETKGDQKISINVKVEAKARIIAKQQTGENIPKNPFSIEISNYV